MVEVSIWTGFSSLAFLAGTSPTPSLSDDVDDNDDILSSSKALLSREGFLTFFTSTCFLLAVCLAVVYDFTAFFLGVSSSALDSCRRFTSYIFRF